MLLGSCSADSTSPSAGPDSPGVGDVSFFRAPGGVELCVTGPDGTTIFGYSAGQRCRQLYAPATSSGWFNLSDQNPGPVTVSFSEPLYGVEIIPSGYAFCGSMPTYAAVLESGASVAFQYDDPLVCATYPLAAYYLDGRRDVRRVAPDSVGITSITFDMAERGRREVPGWGTQIAIVDFLVRFVASPPRPKLTVKCTGAAGESSAAVRGTMLTCAVPTTAIAQSWRFVPDDAGLGAVDYPQITRDWDGALVASGTVTVSGWGAIADAGVKPAETASVHVTATPRPWASQPFQILEPPKDIGQGPLSLIPVLDIPTMQRVMTFGAMELRWSKLSVLTVNSGPNSGYQMVNSKPALGSAAYINRALSGVGPWAARQIGQVQGQTVDPATNLPYCTAAAFPPLRAETVRHEGITGAPNSHYGIWQAELAKIDLSQRMERLVSGQSSSPSLKDAVVKLIATSLAPIQSGPQKQFDSAEYALIPTWSGNCVFIY